MFGVSPPRVPEKDPLPLPRGSTEAESVGLAVVPHTMPLADTFAPPLEAICPPTVAELGVMAVGVLVVRVG